VQSKPLHGLPSVKSARLADQLLRENQQAFFLWKAAPCVITDIHVAKDGSMWAAAFDKNVLDETTSFLRSRRLVLARVLPSLVALVAALPNRTVVWSDADDRFQLEGDEHGPRRAERIALASSVETDLPQALASLAPDGARFLDAFAAVRAPSRAPMSWTPPRDAARARLLARARHTAVAAATCAAVAFAAFGPGIRAARFASASEAELARERGAQLELARDEAELRRITDLLNRVESFRAQRGRITRVVGALSQALPESTAMLSFHVDSAEGSFTAIAPHIADVLPELGSVDLILAPRIVGSVTREVIAGARVERAAFRFRRSQSSVVGAHKQASVQGAP
jgi:hypothetical protein